MPPVRISPGLLLDEEDFRIEGAVLDHGIPCLTFAFEEKLRVNVWCEGISRLGLPVGPWLREAKRALRQGAPDHSEVCVRDGLVISLGNLKQHALRTAPGQKIAYAVDFAYNERNIEKVVALAREADPPLHRGPVPRRRRQYRRRKMAFNGAPGGRQTSVRRPPHSISLLGSLSGRGDELTREAEATSAAAESEDAKHKTHSRMVSDAINMVSDAIKA
jgi:hypothetical protein